jgi:hypothetical protein
MDYATFHRLHARYTKLRQARRELTLQLERFPAAARPLALSYRHAAVDRAVGKIEQRLNALRTISSEAGPDTPKAMPGATP